MDFFFYLGRGDDLVDRIGRQDHCCLVPWALLLDLPFQVDLWVVDRQVLLASSFEDWDRYLEALVVHFPVGHLVRIVEDPCQDRQVPYQGHLAPFQDLQVLVDVRLVHYRVVVSVP